MIDRLEQFFFNTSRVNPEESALCVDGVTLTYSELALQATQLSNRLAPLNSTVCLLFASRSVSAYAGLLGVLNAKKAYVPLNPKFPAERNAAIARRSGAGILLVDKNCRDRLDELLALIDEPLDVVYLDEAAADAQAALEQPEPTDDKLAYIIFTSGTTGPPKGVCVGHGSSVAFIKSQQKFYPPAARARYIQNVDLTFDPSVRDMFMCWGNGGCLYVPDSPDPLHLVEFTKRHDITHWCSVPSIALLMRQMRKLSTNAFPSLQVSIFGGEALSVDLARTWADAAPASRIVNEYGPTEATIACLRFELTPDFLQATELAVTPLGRTWDHMETRVVDENLDAVPQGQSGELVVGGDQLAIKYISDNEVDHQKFFMHSYEEQQSQRWYRTGDLVVDLAEYGLIFQGRTDHQIKLLGNRIELLEVEEVIKQCSRAESSCVIAWPRNASGTPQGLVAFVLNPEVPEIDALAECKRRLPPYAVPLRTVSMVQFPLNANGKVDRSQFLALLQSAERSA